MVFNVGKYTIPMDGMGQDQKKIADDRSPAEPARCGYVNKC